jgi:hypothetical protein
LDLKGQSREEAVNAYAAAVRLTFVSALVFFVVVNLLIAPVRLPLLGRDRVSADIDEPTQGEEEAEDSSNL